MALLATQKSLYVLNLESNGNSNQQLTSVSPQSEYSESSKIVCVALQE